MAAIDPRKLLKQISNSLLRQFFAARGELLDLPWDDLTERKVDLVFEAWQDLPEGPRNEIHLILQDVHYLSRQRSIEALVEMVSWKKPPLIEALEAQASRQDKVMLVVLRAPELIEIAGQFAHTDQLDSRSWYRCRGLPSCKLKVTSEMRQALGAQITAYYGPRQSRGRHCEVAHQVRRDGCDYFFAYLDDYPDKRQELEEENRRFVLRPSRGAFENVFVYNQVEGTLELSATGGKPVREAMQKAFCRGVLGWEWDPSMLNVPPYQLDHLFSKDFPLPIEPGDGIESVEIVRLRLQQRGIDGYVELKCPRNGVAGSIYREMERSLNADRFNASNTHVRSATFSIEFQPEGQKGGTSATFTVTVPRTCNLNDRPEAQRIVLNRCLKRWGIAP